VTEDIVIVPVDDSGIRNISIKLAAADKINCGVPPIVTDCTLAMLLPVILITVPGEPDRGLIEEIEISLVLKLTVPHCILALAVRRVPLNGIVTFIWV
jgi:hypothetical protein